MKSRVVTPTLETSSARATVMAARRTSNATRTLISEFLVRNARIDGVEDGRVAGVFRCDLVLDQQEGDLEEMREFLVAQMPGCFVQLTQSVPDPIEARGALLCRRRLPRPASANPRFDDDLEQTHPPT